MANRIDPETICVCPKCSQRIWRKSHRTDIMDTTSAMSATATVCMHCSSILILENGAWRDPTETEWKPLVLVLGDVAKQFTINRMLAAIEDIDYDVWVELNSAPPNSTPAKSMN